MRQKKTIWVEQCGYFTARSAPPATIWAWLRKRAPGYAKPVRRYLVTRARNTTEPAVGEHLAGSYLEKLIGQGYIVNISG